MAQRSQTFDHVEIPITQVAKRQIVDCVEIEVHRVYPGLSCKPSAKLYWTKKQRVFIFTWIFIHDIAMAGIKRIFPYSRMIAMWSTMKDGRSNKENYVLWKRIDTLSSSQVRRVFCREIAEIQHAAEALELDLECADDDNIRNSIVERKLEEIISTLQSDSEPEASSESDLSEASKESIQTSFRRTRAPLDKAPITAEKFITNASSLSQHQNDLFKYMSKGVQMSRLISDSLGPAGVPRYRRVIYRAYEADNSTTGLRAGLFKNSTDLIFAPPAHGSAEFARYVIDHLSDDKRNVPTPLISFTDNLRTAVYRASKLNRGMIAIVDLHLAKTHLERRFGEAERVFWEAAGVVKNLQLELHGGYTGRGEILLWGEAIKEAIVSMFSFHEISEDPNIGQMLQIPVLQTCPYAAKLRWVMDRSLLPKVKYETGQIVGRFLYAIGIRHWRHLELIATVMATTWEFKGAVAWKRGKRRYTLREGGQYECYCDGVLNGAYVLDDGTLRPLSGACGLTFGAKDGHENDAVREEQETVNMEQKKANREHESIDAGQENVNEGLNTVNEEPKTISQAPEVDQEEPLVIEISDDDNDNDHDDHDHDPNQETTTEAPEPMTKAHTVTKTPYPNLTPTPKPRLVISIFDDNDWKRVGIAANKREEEREEEKEEEEDEDDDDIILCSGRKRKIALPELSLPIRSHKKHARDGAGTTGGVGGPVSVHVPVPVPVPVGWAAMVGRGDGVF